MRVDLHRRTTDQLTASRDGAPFVSEIARAPGLVYRLLAPMRLNSVIERTEHAPWGLNGVKDALANEMFLTTRTANERRLANGELATVAPIRADQVIVRTSGRDYYTEPVERPDNGAVSDLRNGYIGLESARDNDGVVTATDDRGDYVLDPVATAALRAR